MTAAANIERPSSIATTTPRSRDRVAFCHAELGAVRPSRGGGRGSSARQNGGLDIGFQERQIAVGAGEAAMAQGFAGQAERIDGFASCPARTEVLIHLIGKSLAHGVRAQGPRQLIGVVHFAQANQ